jgi:hypothetical protein
MTKSVIDYKSTFISSSCKVAFYGEGAQYKNSKLLYKLAKDSLDLTGGPQGQSKVRVSTLEGRTPEGSMGACELAAPSLLMLTALMVWASMKAWSPQVCTCDNGKFDRGFNSDQICYKLGTRVGSLNCSLLSFDTRHNSDNPKAQCVLHGVNTSFTRCVHSSQLTNTSTLTIL